MKLLLPKLNTSPEHFLRKCGYQEIQNPHKNNEISYARGLEPGRFYPRFHVYLETNKDAFSLSLHLDMKKPSYEGSAAHGGEYEGPVVEKESERLKNAAQKFLSQTPSQPLGFKKEKSIWKKLLDYFQ